MKILQLIIRLFSGLLSFYFGMIKLFGGQFHPNTIKLSDIKILNTPELVFLFFGNSGIHIWMIGLAQALGGLMLIYKKTSVIGAIICTTIYTNIVLINISFNFTIALQVFVGMADLCCILILWMNRQKIKNLFV